MTRTTVDVEIVRRAVRVAARAPSLHNSQPWTWVLDGPELQLYLDRSRIVGYIDAAGREALIGCGVMLDHLRIAMAAAGWGSVVQRFPNPSNFTHVATVDFHPAEANAHARELADAILRRRTDRLPLRPPPDWESVDQRLRALLDGDAVTVDVIDDRLRDELAQASRLTEKARRHDSVYLSELDWWTAPFEFDTGIPRSALNSVAEADQVAVNRAFPTESHAQRRADTGADRAVLLVLSTPADTRGDALAAGEALSRVLLECTAAGLATCPVTHLTETESGCALIADLLGEPRRPQVLVRVGRAPELEHPPAPTPRRQLADILKVRQ